MSRRLEDAYSDILRKARFGLGMELQELADRSDVPEELIAAFESEEAVPTQEQAGRLAQALNLSATAFWHIVEGWTPPPLDLAGPYAVQTFRFAPMDSNGYLVTGGDIRSSLLVDPGDRPQELIAACVQAGGLEAVLLTHSHADHVGAVHKVLEAFPNAAVVGHTSALARLELRAWAKCRSISADSTVQVGAVELRVWAAPGHSDDGLMFGLGDLVFTGDTLFAGSLGRSAQGPSTYGALLRSAHRLCDLPPHTVLLPGHGPATTVEIEMVYNPFLALL